MEPLAEVASQMIAKGSPSRSTGTSSKAPQTAGKNAASGIGMLISAAAANTLLTYKRKPTPAAAEEEETEGLSPRKSPRKKPRMNELAKLLASPPIVKEHSDDDSHDEVPEVKKKKKKKPVKKKAPKKKPQKKSPAKKKPSSKWRTTDVFGVRGKVISRQGNDFYESKLMQAAATEYGKMDTTLIVANIMKAVAAQKPPGRFCTGGRILIPREVRRKVKIDLLGKVFLLVKQEEKKAIDQKKGARKEEALDAEERGLLDDDDIRPTDVLCGRGVNGRKQQKGNILYDATIEKEAKHATKKSMNVLIDRVIGAVESQNPPGRFVCDSEILSELETKKKVSAAIRRWVRQRGLTLFSETEDRNTIRTTDVLGNKSSSYKTHKGSVYFEKLIRKHYVDIEADGMRVVAERVMKAVKAQKPPGRFCTGDRVLSDGQGYIRVVNALRALVAELSRPDETGGIAASADDESPPPKEGKVFASGGQGKRSKRKSSGPTFEAALRPGAVASSTSGSQNKARRTQSPRRAKSRRG